MPSPARIAFEAVPPGADRRTVAWGLLRRLVPAAELANPCPFCGGPHGPVQLRGAPFRASVSYAGGFAVVAVVPVDRAAAVGVDAAVSLDTDTDPADTDGETDAAPRGVLNARRPATIREWTRVEAALKADGRGLRVDPAAVEIREHDDGWRARVAGAHRPLHGWDVPGPPGVCVSVAVRPVTDDEAAAEAPGDRATR